MISLEYAGHVRGRIHGQSVELIDTEIVEVLKFLAVVSCGQGRRFPLTPEADSVWHELILQTASYQDLCSCLPGGGFLHHESITPSQYSERVGDEQFVREWVQWVPDYVHNFGPFEEPGASAWNVLTFLRGRWTFR